MRIALIVPGGVDTSGGRVIPALLWLIERLCRRHTVRVFTLAGHGPSGPLLGATVESLASRPNGWPGESFLRALAGLTASLRRHGPFDAIHAFWADTPGLLAAAAGRLAGIPAVVSLGGGELAALPEIGYGSALRLRGRLRTRLALAGAARITAASGFLARLARESGLAVEEVPLGVPAGWLEAEPATPPGPPWRILHVGDLNRVKDQITLLRAFRRVAEAEPTVHLNVVGADTLGGEIQREAASLALDPLVTFHGRLPPDALTPLYGRAHLLLISSRHEAGPVVALEGAARGVAVAGTAVGHLADWSPRMDCAVPVGDAHALAGLALELLHDPARRARLGASQRAFARTHDADATAAAFERLYAEVAARQRDTRSR